MTTPRLLAMALACAFAVSCTQPAPEAEAVPAPPATAETAPADASGGDAASAATLGNAFTTATTDADGAPGQPTSAFGAADKVYVGVVLRGEAAEAVVKVEWSGGDNPAANNVQTSLPVSGAAVALLDLTEGGSLAPGSYKALVTLDGTPSWELTFQVAP